MTSRTPESVSIDGLLNALAPSDGAIAAIEGRPPGLDADRAMQLARLVVDAERRIGSDPDRVRGLLHQAAALLVDQIARLKVEPPGGRLAPWQVRRAIRFIDENLGRRFHVRELAAALRLSPGYFSHAFRDSFGRSAKSYVIEQRIERAKRLMIETRQSLFYIAKACGFADQAHFSRTFHLIVGDTPSHWRRAMHAYDAVRPEAVELGTPASTAEEGGLRTEPD